MDEAEVAVNQGLQKADDDKHDESGTRNKAKPAVQATQDKDNDGHDKNVEPKLTEDDVEMTNVTTPMPQRNKRKEVSMDIQ